MGMSKSRRIRELRELVGDFGSVHVEWQRDGFQHWVKCTFCKGRPRWTTLDKRGRNGYTDALNRWGAHCRTTHPDAWVLPYIGQFESNGPDCCTDPEPEPMEYFDGTRWCSTDDPEPPL